MVSLSLAFGQPQIEPVLSQVSTTQAAADSDEFVPRNNEPFFPGGLTALQEYLKQTALYPRQARMAQLEGTVRVKFRVQPTGYLTDIQVIESAGPLLNRAAIRAIAQMPRWYPSHRGGEPVARSVIMPISFKME